MQGIWGAMPSLASVAVAKVLPRGERGGALGLVASSVGMWSAVELIVGGSVGQLVCWRPLFAGTLALMLLLIPFALHVLPGGSAEGERRFDLIGGVLLGLGAGLFLFGVTQGQAVGFDSSFSWGSFLVAALALAGFARRISEVRHPFVSPTLFTNRPYVAAVIVGFFSMLANLSILVFVPLLLVEVNGLFLAAAGLVVTPGAAVLAILSPLAGRLCDRAATRPVVVAGLIVMGFSIVFGVAIAAEPKPTMFFFLKIML